MKSFVKYVDNAAQAITIDRSGQECLFEDCVWSFIPPSLVAISAEIDTMGCTQFKGKMVKCIRINADEVKRVWQNSWLHNVITWKEANTAVLLHEIAHVLYTFGEGEENNEWFGAFTGLERYVFNVIEDSRIEYRLSLEYPYYAYYMRMLNAMLKVSIRINASARSSKRNCTIATEMCDQLFDFARFSKIGVGQAFMSFSMPLVLSAIRGNIDNCIKATRCISAYIKRESGISKVEAALVQVLQSSTTVKDRSKIENGDAVQKWISSGILQEADAKHMIGAKPVGKDVQTNDGDSFYRDTVNTFRNEILKVRRMFKDLMNKYAAVQAYDGDLSLMRQQEAYLSSITGDESKDYTVMKRCETSIDVVVLRDVSGSTCNFQTEYARATIVIMAAVESIDGVRSFEADFSDNPIVNKRFDEKLTSSHIRPINLGGTDLVSVLDLLKNEKFESAKHVCFVITDGGYDDVKASKDEMKKMEEKGMKFHVITVGSNGMSVKDLPNEVFGFLRREMLV